MHLFTWVQLRSDLSRRPRGLVPRSPPQDHLSKLPFPRAVDHQLSLTFCFSNPITILPSPSPLAPLFSYHSFLLSYLTSKGKKAKCDINLPYFVRPARRLPKVDLLLRPDAPFCLRALPFSPSMNFPLAGQLAGLTFSTTFPP